MMFSTAFSNWHPRTTAVMPGEGVVTCSSRIDLNGPACFCSVIQASRSCTIDMSAATFSLKSLATSANCSWRSRFTTRLA